MFNISKDQSGNTVVLFEDSEGRDCRVDFLGHDGCEMDIGDGYAVFDADDAVKFAEMIIERFSKEV